MIRDKEILKILQTQAIAAAALVNLQIKCVGKIFTPPKKGDPWLEVVFIPNNLTNETWGNEKTYQGLMRIVLHSQVNNEGPYPLMEKMAVISAQFDKGSLITHESTSLVLKITDHPSLDDIIETPPDILIPLTIRYSCFVT